MLDTLIVGGWFKPEGVEFRNIDDVSKILGAENNPAEADVAAGSEGGASVVDVKGGEVKDNPGFELGLVGVGGETCWSSSCQSDSISSISLSSVSSASVFVDMPLMISDSPRMAKGVELIVATGVGTIDIEVEPAKPA